MFLSLADSGTSIWNLDIMLRFVKNMVRYIEDFVKQEVPLYMTKVLKCLLAKKGKGKNNQNIATPDFRKEIDITPFSLSNLTFSLSKKL